MSIMKIDCVPSRTRKLKKERESEREVDAMFRVQFGNKKIREGAWNNKKRIRALNVNYSLM